MGSHRIFRLFSCRSGAAAVEMGLLAPVLILFLAVIVEVGRGWISYDRFVTVIDNAARWSARFPEFETRVRTGVSQFAIIAGNGILATDKLNLTLRSVELTGGTPKEQFRPYNFFGSAEDVRWQKAVTDGGFGPKEAIIVVSRPLQLPAAVLNPLWNDDHLRARCRSQSLLLKALSLSDRQIRFWQMERDVTTAVMPGCHVSASVRSPRRLWASRATLHNPSTPAPRSADVS